jgi:hypothetical protein
MITKHEVAALMGIASIVGAAACAPTIRLQVDPINIYAKLDANVRISLEDDLRALLAQNPDLF